MFGEKVVDDGPLLRFHLVLCNPVATHSVRAERFGRQPVGKEPTNLHTAQPLSLDDMDAVGATLAKEPLPVLRRCS